MSKKNSALVSVVVGLLAGGALVLASSPGFSLRQILATRAGSAAKVNDVPNVVHGAAHGNSIDQLSQPTEQAPRAACPADMELVEGLFCPKLPYHCGRHSSDLGHGCAEYVRGVACEGEPDPRRYCIDRYEWPNKVGEKPRVYVDWFEAKALCQSAGKRLCRRSEWILACEGPKRLPYPWGFVRQPSPCNVDRASIPFDVNAMLHESTREEELARLWQADPIGSHPDCVSSFGVEDLSGNVDEWTDNLADDPGTDRPSTLNGGYWGPVRNTCRLTTKSHGPTFTFYQVGFRCCADTEDGVSVPPPKPFIERPEKSSPGSAPHEDG